MNSDNISSDLSKANSKNKRFQHRRSQTQSCLTSEAELNDTVDVNIDHMNFMRTNRPNNNPTNQTSRFSGCNNPIKNINIRHLSGVVGGVVKCKNPMVRIQNACFNLIIDQDASDLSKIRKMSMGYQQKGQHSRSASTVLKIRKQSQSKQESLRKKNTSFIAKSKQSLKQRQRQRQKVEKQDDKKICVIKDLTNKLQFTDFDIESWKLQIRKICKLMQELRNFGIADKKINNWCKNYFQSKKRGLIQIFMKKTMKKRSLNNEITYHIIQTQSSLLMRIAQFACPMTEKQRYFLGVEITLYRNFLEQKIANKHKLQLNQIEDRVKSNVEQAQTKQLARQLYQVENANIQVLTFFSDLQRLEQTYGKLNLVSLKNRRRFENINKSEVNIKKIIYD